MSAQQSPGESSNQASRASLLRIAPTLAVQVRCRQHLDELPSHPRRVVIGAMERLQVGVHSLHRAQQLRVIGGMCGEVRQLTRESDAVNNLDNLAS